MKKNQTAVTHDKLAQRLRDFGAQLARLRLARNMPQHELAERAMMSRNTVSRIERGDPGVAFGQVARYLDILGRADLLSRLQELPDPARAMLEQQERRQRASRPNEDDFYDF